jgi:Dullard-like phosphatase family protein
MASVPQPTVVMLLIAFSLLVIAAFATRSMQPSSATNNAPRTQQQKQQHQHQPQPNNPQHRFVLVLDLDETLVHSLPPSNTTVVERPHVHEFLASAAAAFQEVVVFTAGMREYASPILDRLDPDNKIFGRRFYRDDCSVVEAVDAADGSKQAMLVKDLRILGIPEHELGRRVRIVDNTPSAYALQPQCGVPIKSFMGEDAEDRALLDVLARLLVEQRQQQQASSSSSSSEPHHHPQQASSLIADGLFDGHGITE